MSEKNRNLSERYAEMLATYYLDEEFGEKLFLGSTIENILSKEAILIYQNVPDNNYYGASIRYKDFSFIAINTHHNLRIRYYSAAHELWHFIWQNSEMSNEIELDHERAADHFAAVLMLPQNLIHDLWNRMADKYQEEERIIYIADFSSMPYQAVTRRLKEVGLDIPGRLEYLEEPDWEKRREEINLSKSALDIPNKFISFTHFEKLIIELVERKDISLDDAANLIAHFAPGLAGGYIKEKRNLAKAIEEATDE